MLTVRIAPIVAGLLALAAPALAQFEPEAGPSLLIRGVPNIDMPVLKKDFGRIPTSAKQTVQFPFRNTGKAPLQIVQVSSTCGCTGAAPDKREYFPGEGGVITVTFDPTKKHGKVHQTVSVYTNDPDNSPLVIDINADVEQLVMVDQPVLNMETMQRNETKAKTIRIKGRKPDFAVTEVLTNRPDAVTLRIVETKGVEEEGQTLREIAIEVTVKTNAAPLGRLIADLTFKTNDEREPQALATLVADVVGDIHAPQFLPLRVIRPGDPIAAEFKLISRNGRPFRVAKIEQRWFEPSAYLAQMGSLLSITAEGAEESATTFSYKVAGRAPDFPPARPGQPMATTLRGELIITTDVPGEEQIRVPVYGSIRPKV